MKCWNCLHSNPKKAYRCEKCDQALEPNAAQKIAGRRHVEYLLQELDEWEFLDGKAKEQLKSVYAGRLERLNQTGTKAAKAWPETDWVEAVPEVRAEPIPAQPGQREEAVTPALVEEAKPDEEEVVPASEEAQPAPEVPQTNSQAAPAALPAAPDKQPESAPVQFPPAPPSYLERLTGEADIRWFHSLGALLVVAAVVGWLRTSWDSYGRALTGFLIALSPVVLHLVASKLKKAVPLSARLLSILANILTPLALLSLDVFDNLPPQIPSDLYWTFSMLVSCAILNWQAHLTREKLPLYIGGLCCVMAGWSQGALATAAFSLGIGFLFQWSSADGDLEWQHHRKQMSFYAGSFGALASLMLFETSRHPAVPLVAFTGALLFLSLPTLTGQKTEHAGKRLFMQTAITVIGSILMRAALGLSPGGVALYLLFACALFLAAKPDSEFANLSAKIASGLGALALGIGFFSNLSETLNAQQSDPEGLLRVAFAVLGALFFFRASRRSGLLQGSAPLFLLSLCCLLGGWIHLFLQFALRSGVDKIEDLLPLIGGTVVFESLLIVAGRWLRNEEQFLSWLFTFPLLLLTLALTTVCQLLVPIEGPGWTIILAFHAGLALSWERQWLAPAKSTEFKEMPALLGILARLAVVAGILTVFTADGVYQPTALKALLAVHLAASFLLKGVYREASWEATWGLALLALPFFDKTSLLVVALLSNALALSMARRNHISLTLSAAYGALIVAYTSTDFPNPVLCLAPLAFALASAFPAVDEQEPREPGPSRLGLPVLFAAALWLGRAFPTGEVINVLYCLALAGVCGGLQLTLQTNRPRWNRVLAPQTPGLMLLSLFLWSFGQTTTEAGLLFIVVGSAGTAWLSKNYSPEGSTLDPRLQMSSGMVLFGVAQLFTKQHFQLDPGVIAVGVLAVEGALLVARRRSPLISNLVLLGLAFLQQADSILDPNLSQIVALAAIILAVQAVRQTQHPVAALSTLLFLVHCDELMGGSELDIKLRALPLASILVAASIWRFRTEEVWPKAALRVGLALAVAPAFLQFAGGYKMMENFVWLLVVGSAYVGLHFPLPKDLGEVFRQAGGATLVGWVVVSLTRAALKLPWQAATLVIGLALVGVGVYVEKKRRGGAG